MIEIVRRLAPSLVDTVERIQLQPGAMLPSEMLAFVSLCVDQGADAVIESGRRCGYSTEVICEAIDVPVYSVERDSSKAERDSFLQDRYRDRLVLLYGDGQREVPKLIQDYKRPAVLLDGPKNLGALSVVRRVLDECCVIAVHDLAPLNCGNTSERNPGRIDAETFPGVWFTDDETFVREFGWLDDGWINGGGYKGGRSDFIRVTCVLGIFPGGKWCDA